MASVDRAVARVLGTSESADVTYWRLWDVGEWTDHRAGAELSNEEEFYDSDTELIYRSARGRLDQVLDADHIVYWGDFLHMAVYQSHTADVLSRRIGACTQAQAKELVAQTLLLRGVDDEVFDRVLTVGSTLCMNTASDYASGYGKDLSRFLSSAKGVWMRDPYSAHVARSFRGSRQGTTECLDTAFLLHEGGVAPADGAIGVFVGRSNVRPNEVALFGRALQRTLSADAKWLPWGDEPAFWPLQSRRSFRMVWPELEREQRVLSRFERVRTMVGALRKDALPGGAEASIEQLLRAVAGCRLILTDTYHLAVTAWAQGIPAVCLVDDGGSSWDVNAGTPHSRRDKRVDLYSQIDALGLIVKTAGLGHRASDEAHRIADYLRSDELLNVTLARIDELRHASIESIACAFV